MKLILIAKDGAVYTFVDCRFEITKYDVIVHADEADLEPILFPRVDLVRADVELE